MSFQIVKISEGQLSCLDYFCMYIQAASLSMVKYSICNLLYCHKVPKTLCCIYQSNPACVNKRGKSLNTTRWSLKATNLDHKVLAKFKLIIPETSNGSKFSHWHLFIQILKSSHLISINLYHPRIVVYTWFSWLWVAHWHTAKAQLKVQPASM